MLRLFSLFTIMAAATAFTAQPWGLATKKSLTPTRTQTARFMFSADGDDVKPSPLAEVTDVAEVEATTEMAAATEAEPEAPRSMVRNLMKGGEAKEVKWVDPAMAANTNPFLMNWWAYLFFGIMPATLLLNDAFHFIPKDGALGFLGRM
jgi:hypothetical protein